MKILVNQARPSALIPACVRGVVASMAPAIAQHQPAISVGLQQGLAVPAAGFHAQTSMSIKINNYMGTTSAKGVGMALSIIENRAASVQRANTVEVNKVEGGDARGIPPRGRPV